jgi:hypothetical protein
MPVPSTMTGFTLTMVFTLRARVASAHAFIMIGGPMATTSARSGFFSKQILRPSVTMPRMPLEPSLVHRMSSSHTLLNLSSQKTRSWLRKPTIPIT